MILFKDIYKKAFNLFDDPDLNRIYVRDTVQWQKEMYDFLKNGVGLFTNPTAISFLLVDTEDPEGKIEIFDGDGTASYQTELSPKENSDYCFMIGREIDYGATYDEETNTVTFSRDVPVGTKCSFEWYYCGKFLTDFSTAATSRVPANVINARVQDILARAVVICWAEHEKSAALNGARSILTDTDFKIYSSANQLLANVNWVKDLRWSFDNMQTKLGWDLYSRKHLGGRYYGS